MTESKKLAKNTVLIAISKLSAQLISFLLLPVYTTILSAGDYGTVDLIITYASLFSPLVMLNIESAVFRYLVDARGDKELRNRIITNAVEIVILTGLVACILFAVVSMIISIPIIGVVVFYFLSNSISNIILQIARGLGKVKAFAISGIASGFIGSTLSLLLMLGFAMGPTGMLLGLGIGALVPSLALVFIIRIPQCVKMAMRDRGTKRELLRYSLPLIPNEISWWVFNASDRTIISVIVGAAANGIYAVSNKFSGALSSLWGIFYIAWTESAALNINNPNRNKFFSEICNMSFRVFGSLAIIGTALTSLVFPFLANAQYNEALLYVPVLMFGGLLNIIVGFYSAVYVARKLTRQIMNTSIIAAVINIVINLGLVWFIDVWAAAISTVVAYGVMAIYRHYDMKKYVNIKYEKGIFVKVFGLFAIVAGLYYVDNIFAHIAGLLIAVVAGVWVNRELIKSGWKMIRRKMK